MSIGVDPNLRVGVQGDEAVDASAVPIGQHRVPHRSKQLLKIKKIKNLDSGSENAKMPWKISEQGSSLEPLSEKIN